MWFTFDPFSTSVLTGHIVDVALCWLVKLSPSFLGPTYQLAEQRNQLKNKECSTSTLPMHLAFNLNRYWLTNAPTCALGIGYMPILNYNMQRPSFNLLLSMVACTHKAGHSGSNLASNIAHFKTSLLMWHIVNEERNVWSNIICYYNITQTKAKWVCNVINAIIYDTTCMLLCTMKVVTKTSVICMTLV